MKPQSERNRIRLSCWPVIIFTLFGAVCVACNPVFAPPVRAALYGTPGRLADKTVEITGSSNYVGMGGPAISYTLSNWFQLEGGADMYLIGGRDNWVMGWAGIRSIPVDIEDGLLRFAVDLEAGGGAGVGGAKDCDDDNPNCQNDKISWNSRLAGGGYAGFGLGLHIKWFSVFARFRGQYTAAKGIPNTFWCSGVGGIGLNIVNTVRFHVGGGWGQYFNSVSSDGMPVVDASLSVAF